MKKAKIPDDLRPERKGAYEAGYKAGYETAVLTRKGKYEVGYEKGYAEGATKFAEKLRNELLFDTRSKRGLAMFLKDFLKGEKND